ncbi:MAG: hypothetical protein H8E48_05610 [Chloroflexi bacterium]|nr:hypothetical protein [Chloroflexota bacterium]
MAHYQIEISHPDKECISALNMIVDLGLHMLHHTWWGCESGVHKGWLDIEADTESDAMSVVPPPVRKDAIAVETKRFTSNQIRAFHD